MGGFFLANMWMVMFLVKSGGDLAFEIYLPLLGPCLPLLGRLLALQAGDAQ